MPTPLEKARKDPDSMKAKILKGARIVFGEYGYHGATTRMIADVIGVDISTVYYHWGEKSDLYEAVVLDVYADLREMLADVEKVIHGKPLTDRLDIALDMTSDYLFDHPEISNLILFRYFGKTRDEAGLDFMVPEIISDIAYSMGLCKDKKKVSAVVNMQVMVMMNSIHNFVSGEGFFRSILNIPRDEYIAKSKETLKFMLIPPYNGTSRQGGA